jgi:hypothetical protein
MKLTIAYNLEQFEYRIDLDAVLLVVGIEKEDKAIETARLLANFLDVQEIWTKFPGYPDERIKG